MILDLAIQKGSILRRLCFDACPQVFVIFISLVILSFFMISVCAGQEGLPPPTHTLKNIALGKTYTLDPQPNYSYSTDPDDRAQLTDGKYTSGYFWTQKSTVGWFGKIPVITIDLGDNYPIKGISFNTASGVAGVQWPSQIYVLVSDDGKIFYEAGELVALSESKTQRPKNSGVYQVHRYWTDVLATHGRYLSLVVLGKPFIFVDEIEVYAGDDAGGEIPFNGPPILDWKSFIPGKLVCNHVNSRLLSDIQSIRTTMTLKPGSIDSDIAARLASVEEELLNSGCEYSSDFQAIIPLNPLHERIFKIQAKIWKNMGFPQLTVWQNALWDPLEPIHIPSLASSPSVHVHTMLNEYRAGAFYVSNASDKDIELRLEIVGLPGGSNPPYITVHEVAWTGTSGGYSYPAALPESQKLDDAFIISTPSGLTRQVWFTFHPTNIAPGVYHGSVVLTGGAQRLEVPLTLNIYPFHFPDQPTLHLGGWDYTNADTIYGVTQKNREKIITHLREHFVDSPWATSSVLPFVSSENKDITQPDTTNFDTWLQLWPGARQYCVFVNVQKQLMGSPMGTPEFAEKVKRWVTFWAKHAQLRGLRPEQLNLLLVDEPSTPEQDEIILQWSRAIHAAGTGVKIWEDPAHKDLLQANQEMMTGCDVLCPNRWSILNPPLELKDFFIQRQKQGMELALYSCSGPARELDPYTYYRLQAWSCWEHSALSSYFWAFSDNGGASSWKEYKLSGTAYVPFFLDNTSVIAGKQMEAIREGVEDFEYLVMLRERIADLEKREPSSDILDRARQLLFDAPKLVNHVEGVNFSLWSEQKNRNLADKMRLEILEMLVEIQRYSEIQLAKEGESFGSYQSSDTK